MAKKRLTREFFEEAGKRGGKKAWATMSAEERSAELKRRAKVRAKNAETKKRKSKARSK